MVLPDVCLCRCLCVRSSLILIHHHYHCYHSYQYDHHMAGIVAERLNVWLTYDIMIGTSLVLLVILPAVATQMPHDSTNSSGFKLFMALLCVIGLMYGGGMALFYSIIFDVYGPRNYRSVFSVTVIGFALAVLVGGLSSSYSFQPQPADTIDTTEEAEVSNSNRYCIVLYLFY